jgi:hypothetical protein
MKDDDKNYRRDPRYTDVSLGIFPFDSACLLLTLGYYQAYTVL